jgi:hypothetical protein
MANLGETFNTDEMDLGGDIVPAGTYIVQAVGERERDTNGGRMVTIEFQILDGIFENRRVFVNYNYLNQSADAQRIAKRDLGRLGVAVKKNIFSDTLDLHNIPFVADIGVQQDKKGQYPDQNIIRAYHTIDEAERAKASEEERSQGGGARPASNSTSASKPAAASGGRKPWK